MTQHNHCTECGRETYYAGLCDHCKRRKRCHECGSTIYYNGLCHNCKERKKREACQSMSKAEVDAKIEEIITELDDTFDDKEAYYDFWRLLAYHNISTAKIAEAAIRAGVFFPSELYRDADSNVRKQLISLLMEPDCATAFCILHCLADTYSDDVLAVFKELDAHPLPWSKTLHIPLLDYTHASGWAINQHGNRIELIFRECYPVFRVADGNDTDTAVSVATLRGDRCSRCDSLLIDLLTIDGNDERLAFLNLPGVIRIPVCPVCVTLCEPYIIRYTLDGDSVIDPGKPFRDSEKILDSEYAEWTPRRFALAKKQESLYFANGNDESIITIGGFANWVQGYQFDTCPDCGKTMRYFASVPWEAWEASEAWLEGTLYLEICTDCQVISVFHQQT